MSCSHSCEPRALHGICCSRNAFGRVTLTNLDTEPFTWTVTERGERAELTVGAGQTVEFCTDGCFVIGPSGDRAALIGNEHLEIRGGLVRVI